MSTEGGIDLEETNPYEDHQELTKLEAEVLWEYAKLAKNVKSVRDTPLDASCNATNNLLQLLLKTRELSEAPDEGLLGQLRTLERKMGLVLTLVRAALMSFDQLLRCFPTSSKHPYGQLSMTDKPLRMKITHMTRTRAT